MPTVFRQGPYRFYFFSHEPNEPPHVHVVARLVRHNQGRLLEAWHGYLATSADERVKDVRLSEDSLTVDLMDGRAISVPLAWYPRLMNATAAQRNHWEISAGGFGIYWPEIDEDLSTEGLLRGAPAPQPH